MIVRLALVVFDVLEDLDVKGAFAMFLPSFKYSRIARFWTSVRKAADVVA